MNNSKKKANQKKKCLLPLQDAHGLEEERHPPEGHAPRVKHPQDVRAQGHAPRVKHPQEGPVQGLAPRVKHPQDARAQCLDLEANRQGDPALGVNRLNVEYYHQAALAANRPNVPGASACATLATLYAAAVSMRAARATRIRCGITMAIGTRGGTRGAPI